MEKKYITKISILIFGLLVISGPQFYRLHKSRSDLRRQVQFQKQRIESLQKNNAALEEEIRLLKEDADYQEEVARKELGLIKKGETIYRTFPDD